MSRNLSGKVALITGSGSGIGAATALHFLTLGCNVAINGRNVDKLNTIYQECLESCMSSGAQVIMVPGDVSDEAVAPEIVQKTIDAFGKLNILVNNAGVSLIKPMMLTSLEEFDHVFKINVRSVFHMTQLCLPHLRKTNGNVVNVSSVAAQKAFALSPVYSTSKAAVDHLTRNMALELGIEQIRVNAVNPGAVVTDFVINDPNIESKERATAIWEEFGKSHALCRVARPEEIAAPIAFLASEDASFMTGHTMVVDAGFLVKGAGMEY